MAPAHSRLRAMRPAHRARFRGDVIAEGSGRQTAVLCDLVPPISGGVAIDDIERDIARLSAELPVDDPELIAVSERAAEAEREARLWETVGEVLAKEQSQ